MQKYEACNSSGRNTHLQRVYVEKCNACLVPLGSWGSEQLRVKRLRGVLEVGMKKIGKVIASILLCVACCSCTSSGDVPQESVEVLKTPNATITVKETANPGEGTIVTDVSEIEAMADAIVNNLTLEEKIGQMFVVNLEELDTSHGDFYDYRKYTKKMGKIMGTYHVGGVILFSRNVENIDQTETLISDLQENSNIPLFVSVDEEGGDVARIANNPNMYCKKFPSMEEVGAKEDENYAYTMGETIGKQIKELGFNVDFAPVADVKTNELNTEIGNRSFGSNPDKVAKMVAQVVYGIQDQGISASLKHFPGHGGTTEDSHEKAVNSEDDLYDLRKTAFRPFEAGIDAGADFVMVSHISISKVTGNTIPASMSKVVIQNMLRDELGFEGVVITDAMDMGAITKKYSPDKAAVKVVQAGSDVVLMTTNLKKAYRAVWDAVQTGTISEEQIDTSVKRIIKVKLKRGVILSNTTLAKQ